MIVEYDADLIPGHRITQYDTAFVRWMEENRDKWVELSEYVPHGELVLEQGADGAICALHAPEGGERRPVAIKPRLKAFRIDAPVAMKAGQEARFSGVPLATMIRVNGQPVDVMDESGVYDLEPATAGRYVVRFSCRDYADREWTYEATA